MCVVERLEDYYSHDIDQVDQDAISNSDVGDHHLTGVDHKWVDHHAGPFDKSVDLDHVDYNSPQEVDIN